ncbi:hypothetical protein IVB27_32965 [Bradyrhizobium sp. 197]|uniref:hypothetical protein n=1 Tax=Bradyrhizobium sp. 197 TaxID=2782663 RepID=UPI001FF76995|nr:hypothetical protein [Bradyrhizobium sp. 197]MCK1479427.1 hypothetical protein [Bradyrhizobium sp. 197]
MIRTIWLGHFSNARAPDDRTTTMQTRNALMTNLINAVIERAYAAGRVSLRASERRPTERAMAAASTLPLAPLSECCSSLNKSSTTPSGIDVRPCRAASFAMFDLLLRMPIILIVGSMVSARGRRGHIHFRYGDHVDSGMGRTAPYRVRRR